jgi:hypothetical protein
MKSVTFKAGLFLVLISFAVRAAGWTSPDGKLSFDLPADGSLVEMDNPPAPATAIWMTADGSARLMFLSQANPGNSSLRLAGLTEGTVAQFPGATVISSNETSMGGARVYTIAAQIKGGGYIQQSIVAFNGVVYKMMAMGPVEVSSDPRLSIAFGSVKVLDPNPIAPPEPKMSGHETSMMIAKIGFIVIIIAAVAKTMRRKSS